jgi:hypothetical protein
VHLEFADVTGMHEIPLAASLTAALPSAVDVQLSNANRPVNRRTARFGPLNATPR